MLGKIEQGAIVISGQPTATFIQALPHLEGRRRWQARKFVCEFTKHNHTILDQAGVEWLEDVPEPPRLEFTSDYKSLTDDFPHQVRAKAKARGRAVMALFMEQGTGKTKVAIDLAGELHCAGKLTGVLVVSKKGVHRQWIEGEIPKHCGCPWQGAYWTGKPELVDWSGQGLQWYAINYDALKFDGGYEAAMRFARAHHATGLLVVGDESQEVKDESSARAKAFAKLKPFSTFRLITTGTPIAKDLTDEWSQLKWLDENIIGIRYKTAFRRRYCIMGGFQNRAVVGHVNVEQFKALTAPHVFRATKEEIGILPKVYNEWHFDMTQEQMRHLREMKKELETMIERNLITAAHAATRIIKMQQIRSGFAVDENDALVHIMPLDRNPVIQAAHEWLEAGEGKAIVWFRFREEGRMLMQALDRYERVDYHGGTNDKQRAANIASFMHPRGAQLLIANEAASTGLNLQGLCRRNLYFANGFNAISRWQSEDRTHRIGTTDYVTFTDLIGNRTFDRYILANLRKKKSLSSMVLDDVRTMLGEIT